MSTSVRQPLDGELVARHRDILATIAHLGGEATMKEIQGHLSDVYGLPEREVVPGASVYRALNRLVDRDYLEKRMGEDFQRYALTTAAEEQLWSIGQYYNLFGELNGAGGDE